MLRKSGTNTLDNTVEDSSNKPNVISSTITLNDEMHDALHLFGKKLSFTPLNASDVQLIRKIGVGQVCETFEGVLVSCNMPVAVKKPLSRSSSELDRGKVYRLVAAGISTDGVNRKTPQYMHICGHVSVKRFL